MSNDSNLVIGACIRGGRLYATVMRREADGASAVVAMAEMDVEALKSCDCVASMQTPTAEADRDAPMTATELNAKTHHGLCGWSKDEPQKAHQAS